MNIERSNRLMRIFLFGLIGSIILGAILGVIIVLAGSWSPFELKVLATAGIIGVASIGGMACGAPLTRGQPPGPAAIGIGLTVAAAALSVIGLWAEVGSTEFWQVTSSLVIVAIAAAHISLLSLARLASSYRWSQLGAYLASVLAAGTIIALIWSDGMIDDLVYRWLAVILITDAAFTTMVPIFHVLSRRRLAEEAAAGGDPTDATTKVGGEGQAGAVGGRTVASIDSEIAELQTRIADLERERERLGAGTNHST